MTLVCDLTNALILIDLSRAKNLIASSKISFSKQAETSWANVRVTPHSQVHFGSKKILGKKSPNIFSSETILGPKKLWVQERQRRPAPGQYSKLMKDSIE